MNIRRALMVLILALAPSSWSQEDQIMQAMKEELDRSMSGLRVENQPPPYYIAYTILDVTTTNIRATLGATLEDQTNRGRLLGVEVRVGNYDFDSSRFVSLDRMMSFAPMFVQATLDADPDMLRRQLWVASDAAYKGAVTLFSRKKAAFQNRIEAEPIPDFSKETPAETVLLPPAISPVGKEWVETVRRISAVFRETPAIDSSEASLNVAVGARYFLNSEGFKTVAPVESISLRVFAETQADDGMMLRDFFTEVGNDLNELPPPAALVARARELAANLAALRAAPVGEDYSGPVMVEGQASAELLAQTFVPLFLSQRSPDGDNPAVMQMAQAQANPFLTRIGSRILPESFTVSDTPSVARFSNLPVAGAYAVDEEGVRAQDVSLVKEGRLQTMLTSRTPQKNLLQSNGHARGGSAQAGVFQMQSLAAMPAAKMKEKLLELLKLQGKPYGYIIRLLGNPALARLSPMERGLSISGATARSGPQVLRGVKVFPDGKETPVRGLYLGNVSHTAFKDIVAASEERLLYNCRQMPTDVSGVLMMVQSFAGVAAGVTGVPMSLIVPSLIFEELEVQRGKDIQQKPPTVPSPLK